MQFNQKVVNDLLIDLEKASSLYQPSAHWKHLNKVHLNQLIEGNINNFKRSVNMKYFNWGTLGIIVHQMTPILTEIKRGNLSIFLQSSFKRYNARLGNRVTEFDFFSAQLYKVFIASLFNYTYQRDHFRILDNVKEPKEGNPFLVRYKNRVLSQDLCNSTLELYSSIKGLKDIKKGVKMNVMEIGAGYGRLAYVFLKTFPNVNYCIVDIPLALYLAQEYLTRVFPNEKIFYYRNFKSFKEVEQEFKSARIRFIMANQIEFLPKKMFHLVINVSSLHEMRREQIKNYLNQIDRLCKGHFYQKQWRKSRIRDNNYIQEFEYPIPKKWETLYHQKHPVQKMFFEALYKI